MPKAKPKKKGTSRGKKKGAKKRSTTRTAAHTTHTTVPRGMMLVPAPHASGHRKGAKGRRPRRRNPAGGELLKSAGASVLFGTAAAAAGILGGFALSKANLKSKWANVGVNVAAGAIAGGGLGMLDRTAGTVVAHNFMVAAGQWLMTEQDAGAAAGGAQLPAGSGATPNMMKKSAAASATHGLYDEPDPEAITPPLPAPRQLGSPMDNLGGFQNVSGLGSPMDNLGGFSNLSGVVADDMGDGDDMGAFQHLDGILADNLGDDLEALGDDLDAVVADDLGDEDFGDDDL